MKTPMGDRSTPEHRLFVHLPGDPMDVEARLSVGASMRIELHPAGGYGWTSIESSDPGLADAVGEVGPDRVARFTATAHRVGTVVLLATTSHSGDRFGPPTRRWMMRLSIESGDVGLVG